MTRALAALALSLLVAAGRPTPAQACAPAPRKGEAVTIADEEAIIAWDPATRSETFVRRARFASSSTSFGFLVPTPTKPTLGEVDSAAFYSLADAIRPREVTDTSGYDIEVGALVTSCVMTAREPKSAPPPAGASVRVLGAEHVAGFDATILEADDAASLSAWLGSHGFDETPALTAWLAWYVEHDWKITAFVIANPVEGSRYVDTGNVAMTFQTDQPFYPYREPATETSAPDRSLRVYFLSDQRYRATLDGTPWRARLLHAGHLGPVDALARVTPQRHASVFVDEGPRRGTHELYFAPSPDQGTVEQPPNVHHRPKQIFIPVDVIALAAVIGFLVARGIRRRRAHQPKL